jgi:hypothetical protein
VTSPAFATSPSQDAALAVPTLHPVGRLPAQPPDGADLGMNNLPQDSLPQDIKTADPVLVPLTRPTAAVAGLQTAPDQTGSVLSALPPSDSASGRGDLTDWPDDTTFALGGLFAGSTTGGSLSANSPTLQGLPVPQVAAQITNALVRSTGGATELSLSPDELGHVRLRLETDSSNPDRMVVMITFERPETLDLFRRHAGELADALRQAGFAGADIGFGQQGNGSFGSERREGLVAPAFGPDSPPDAAAPTDPPPRHRDGASLDLRL